MKTFVSSPIRISVDNQAAMLIAKNQITSERIGVSGHCEGQVLTQIAHDKVKDLAPTLQKLVCDLDAVVNYLDVNQLNSSTIYCSDDLEETPRSQNVKIPEKDESAKSVFLTETNNHEEQKGSEEINASTSTIKTPVWPYSPLKSIKERLVVPDPESGRSRQCNTTTSFEEPCLDFIPVNPEQWCDQTVRGVIFKLADEIHQYELGKLCPLSHGMISKILRNKYVHTISHKTCLKFAKWYFKYREKTAGKQDGDNFNGLEGREPAKEILHFSIFSYQNLEMFSSNVSSNGIENLHRLGSSQDSYRSYHLGDVEISSDATLEDLKTKVLTLEPLTVYV
nr:uncharacterized protein LOC110282867 [Parasteatoda tepidariorum]